MSNATPRFSAAALMLLTNIPVEKPAAQNSLTLIMIKSPLNDTYIH